MSIFLFYVLCEIQKNEYHIAGYFSKVIVILLRSNKPKTTLVAFWYYHFFNVKGMDHF